MDDRVGESDQLASNVEVLTTNAVNLNIVVQPYGSAEASARTGPEGLVNSMAAVAANGPAGLVQNVGSVRGPPMMMPPEKPGKFDGTKFK